MPRRGRGLGAWLGGGGEVAVPVWLAGFGCSLRYTTRHGLAVSTSFFRSGAKYQFFEDAVYQAHFFPDKP